MKKVVRTVWISLLSGLAFLAACTSSHGLTRSEKKELKAERSQIVNQLRMTEMATSDDPKLMLEHRSTELELRNRLTEINTLLGDSQAQKENEQEIGYIVNQMDSLSSVIKESELIPLLYGSPIPDPTYPLKEKEKRRAELMEQLDQLNRTLRQREGACVYGSPEVIDRYEAETFRLKKAAAEINQQLKDLDNE